MAGLLKAVEPKLLVTLAPALETISGGRRLKAVEGLTGLRAVLAVDLAPYASPDEALRPRDLASRDEIALEVPVLDFRAELEKERGDTLDFPPPEAGAISSCFCTGGTTGAPKIARRTHASEAFDAWAMTSFTEALFGRGKTIFCGLPLFHVNGQLVTGLAPWSKGGHVVMGTPEGYRGKGVIANFWALVEHFRITMFSGVPTVYSALLQSPIAARTSPASNSAICGAAPMPVQLFESFQRRDGRPHSRRLRPDRRRLRVERNPSRTLSRASARSALRFPYQDMRALILDDDDTDISATPRPTRSASSPSAGPNVFAGYLDPAHNKGIWIERAGRDLAEHRRPRPTGR